MSGPCDWPVLFCGDATDESGEATECAHLNSLSPEIRQMVIDSSVEFLWNATGQKYGTCEITVRPCGEDCWSESTYRGWSGAPAGGIYGAYGWYGYGGPIPVIMNGEWFNIVCGQCNGRCDHSHMSWIRLPGVVSEVLEVTLDGDVFTDWVYDNWGLGRTDGKA